jgi:phospholipid/cholesterol/gamma-HCH transport system substrate-binding protein
MIKFSRELKTGLVGIIAVALGFWGYNFLMGMDILDSVSDTYYVRFDNVEGLDESSDVTINGHKIGGILDIKFDGSEDGLLVKFNVTEDFHFSPNSEIFMYSSSMLGSKDLKIIPAQDGLIADSETIFKGQQEEDLITALTNRIAPIEENLDQTLTTMNTTFERINSILDEQMESDLKGSVASMNRTMHQVEEMTKPGSSLYNTLEEIESLSKELNTLSQTLNELEIKQLVERFDRSLAEINLILAKMNNGEGTIGLLLEDEALYRNLESATEELNALLKEVREHPKRFVHFSLFGKKEEAYQEPEIEVKKDSIK